MNKQLKLVWLVTKWEFFRFFKWMDLLKGLMFMGFFMLVGFGVSFLMFQETRETPLVAIADYGPFEPEVFEHDGFRFEGRTSSHPDTLAVMLDDGEIDAILTIGSADGAVLQMRNDRPWSITLRQYLNGLRTEHKLTEYGIDESLFVSIQAGMEVGMEFQRGSGSSTIDKVLAGAAIFLVLMAVFMGFAYQFTAITAEKQQRITEQVISAISPQTWIDGKILGITGIGLTYVIFYGGLGLLAAFLLVQFTNAPFGDMFTLIDFKLVIVFLILSLLGILMWNAFLAAVAATIDDPNSSERSGLMMLPNLPVMFAFLTLVNPDSLAIKILSQFPLTSYAVLPARMVLTQTFWWEPLTALLLLGLTVHLFRRIAGKVFATGMMLYGKEPSFKEMFHWFRRA